MGDMSKLSRDTLAWENVVNNKQPGICDPGDAWTTSLAVMVPFIILTFTPCLHHIGCYTVLYLSFTACLEIC